MSEKTMNSKFSAELIEAMKDNAPLNWEKAKELGLLYDEKPKAIVASAVRLKIPYLRIEKTASGDKPVTKAEMVADLANAVGLSADDLDGLDKATVTSLKRLSKAVCALC